MKLGIFTDPHYSSAELTCGRRYNSRSLAKIQAALARFAAERFDLVVCLGDLIDREPTHEAEATNLAALARVFVPPHIISISPSSISAASKN